MIRRSIFPLATLAFVALALTGCATTRNVAGEPTPKAEGEPAAPAPGGESALGPSEQGAKPASTPPPALVAPTFIPAGKPAIIARVDKVQFPAWVERAGIKAGIKAGWAIYTSDHIVTGGEGRVELSTAGEGRLKVGGDTHIEFTEAYEFTGGNVEPSLFTLHRGSFTYTGAMVRGGAPGTLIELEGAIFANVLGGQVYGQVNSDEALITLIDGAAQVSGPKLNPGTMREPATFLRVPRTGRANPVTAATSDKIARWASAPAVVAGRPTLSGDGAWDVSLNSGYSVKQLETMACQIQRRGFPSEIYPVKEPGKLTWYRVVVRRFATKNDAVNFLNTAKALGSKEPWVLVPG